MPDGARSAGPLFLVGKPFAVDVRHQAALTDAGQPASTRRKTPPRQVIIHANQSHHQRSTSTSATRTMDCHPRSQRISEPSTSSVALPAAPKVCRSASNRTCWARRSSTTRVRIRLRSATCHPSSGTSSSDPRKESQKRKGPHVSGPFFEGVASVRLPKDHAAKAQVQRQLVGNCRAELVGEPVHHVLLAAEVNDPLYAYDFAGHVIGVTQPVD